MVLEPIVSLWWKLSFILTTKFLNLSVCLEKYKWFVQELDTATKKIKSSHHGRSIYIYAH